MPYNESKVDIYWAEKKIFFYKQFAFNSVLVHKFKINKEKLGSMQPRSENNC